MTDEPVGSRPSVALVMPTMNRPYFVEVTLRHLLDQTVAPQEIVVVDASPGSATRDVVAEFPGVAYLHSDLGLGTTAESRDMGYRATSGDVVAFLDDDAHPAPDWLERLLDEYADETVGGVGGRISNGEAGEEIAGVGAVGRFLADGTLTGNFTADTGRTIEVDHLLGANMSFRRRALDAVGGIHGHYPSPCLREETDIAFRVKLQGWRLLFTPRAVVYNDFGPYVRGERFDYRYHYIARRNHVVLLARTVGPRSARFTTYLRFSARSLVRDLAQGGRALGRVRSKGPRAALHDAASAVAHAVVDVAGVVAGLVAAPADRWRDRRADRARVVRGPSR